MCATDALYNLSSFPFSINACLISKTVILKFSHPSPFSLKEASHSKFFSTVNLFQHFLFIGANLTYEARGSGPCWLQTPRAGRNQILAVCRAIVAGTPRLQSQQLDSPCLSEAKRSHTASHSFSQANSVCWADADIKMGWRAVKHAVQARLHGSE